MEQVCECVKPLLYRSDGMLDIKGGKIFCFKCRKIYVKAKISQEKLGEIENMVRNYDSRIASLENRICKLECKYKNS